jgi:hypothetical protein
MQIKYRISYVIEYDDGASVYHVYRDTKHLGTFATEAEVDECIRRDHEKDHINDYCDSNNN